MKQNTFDDIPIGGSKPIVNSDEVGGDSEDKPLPKGTNNLDALLGADAFPPGH